MNTDKFLAEQNTYFPGSYEQFALFGGGSRQTAQQEPDTKRLVEEFARALGSEPTSTARF